MLLLADRVPMVAAMRARVCIMYRVGLTTLVSLLQIVYPMWLGRCLHTLPLLLVLGIFMRNRWKRVHRQPSQALLWSNSNSAANSRRESAPGEDPNHMCPLNPALLVEPNHISQVYGKV